MIKLKGISKCKLINSQLKSARTTIVNIATVTRVTFFLEGWIFFADLIVRMYRTAEMSMVKVDPN